MDKVFGFLLILFGIVFTIYVSKNRIDDEDINTGADVKGFIAGIGFIITGIFFVFK